LFKVGSLRYGLPAVKTAFPGYYRPSEEEFQVLWRSATFAFDASFLLSVYGSSKITRDQLLTLLEGLQDRLWLPHQFNKRSH